MMKGGVRILVFLIGLDALTGCRQLFGIDDTEVARDAARADARGADATPRIDAIAFDAPPVVCPTGYTGFGGHSYRAGGSQKSWTDARDDCADDVPTGGSYLFIPDTAFENDAIASVLSSDTWIGVTDSALEGTWVTVLGTEATYVNWETGEPDGSPLYNCVRLRQSGDWADESCTQQRAFTCECNGTSPD